MNISINTKLINHIELNKYSLLDLEVLLNKKQLAALQTLITFEKNQNLLHNKYLLEHQNTNKENYHFILKDLIADINKTSALIIDSLKTLHSLNINLLEEDLTLIGHKIHLNESTGNYESYTIKDLYVEYLNSINKKAFTLKKYLDNLLHNKSLAERFTRYAMFCEESANIESDYNCCLENGELVKINLDNMFNYSKFQSKREAISLKLGDELKTIRKTTFSIPEDVDNAISFFSNRKRHFNNMYFSVNLSDEKIIDKKSSVLFYEVNNTKFEMVVPGVLKVLKKSMNFNYNWNESFEISYYIKKYLIETYTKKDFFAFMCHYKDYLRRFVYFMKDDRQSAYNHEHPAIKETQLMFEITNDLDKYESRYNYYYDKLQNVYDKESALFVNKNILEWNALLQFPAATYNLLQSKCSSGSKELEILEVLAFLNEITTKNIDTFIKSKQRSVDETLLFENLEKVENYFDEVVEDIYNKLYIEDEANVEKLLDLDISRFFNNRERASFHTTLKDSLVIDFRNEKENHNKAIQKKIEEGDMQIIKLVELLKTHKYHDFLEIDINSTKKDSKLNILELINVLELINKFNFAVPQKCGLKLRKLKHYNATGIYFSYFKMVGIDYREGISAYMHELAHHIDLNTSNSKREALIDVLYKYFSHRLNLRRDYYLKNEELIARAAEISLLLLIGRYKQFKEFYDRGEINEATLIKSIKSTFEKSKYSKCMVSWNKYKSLEYIDVENQILDKKFFLLDTLVAYFQSFWSGRVINEENNKILSSITKGTNNENKFVKDNEYSYKYFYRNLFSLKIESKNDKKLADIFANNIIRTNFAKK